MDTKELVKRGSDEVVALYCGKCGLVYRISESHLAEACCQPIICSCGKPAPKGWTICDECRRANDEAKEKALFEKAEKVVLKDYKIDYVYWEGIGNDGFATDDELEDWLSEQIESERPEWVWACKEVELPKLNAHDLIEHITQDSFEGADERLDADDLQKVLDEWHARQERVIFYEPDFTKVVLIGELLAEVKAEEEEAGT